MTVAVIMAVTVTVIMAVTVTVTVTATVTESVTHGPSCVCPLLANNPAHWRMQDCAALHACEHERRGERIAFRWHTQHQRGFHAASVLGRYRG